MFAWWRRRRRERLLRAYRLPASHLAATIASLPCCRGLDTAEQERLRDLVSLFLAEKAFEPVEGFVCTEADRLAIAVQACLPILELGFDWYDEWVSVVVYPNEFLVDYEEMDEAGVVHAGRDLRIGEAWDYGPLVLSLEDVHASTRQNHHEDGYNVVMHECAHKLDMCNGDANGFPPLHRGMSRRAWTRAFSEAFADMNRRLDAGQETPLDSYAAESPAECFAVFSEYFFVAPQVLNDVYPAVYTQLRQFYRQDPGRR
ncbi:MAG TPA: zinc-dependent peptidase [Thioalkalivibrio sp.]|nr:zinc-dependent peptidase [Thioalkalivibrio sp.]